MGNSALTERKKCDFHEPGFSNATAFFFPPRFFHEKKNMWQKSIPSTWNREWVSLLGADRTSYQMLCFSQVFRTMVLPRPEAARVGASPIFHRGVLQVLGFYVANLQVFPNGCGVISQRLNNPPKKKNPRFQGFWVGLPLGVWWPKQSWRVFLSSYLEGIATWWPAVCLNVFSRNLWGYLGAWVLHKHCNRCNSV